MEWIFLRFYRAAIDTLLMCVCDRQSERGNTERGRFCMHNAVLRDVLGPIFTHCFSAENWEGSELLSCWQDYMVCRCVYVCACVRERGRQREKEDIGAVVSVGHEGFTKYRVTFNDVSSGCWAVYDSTLVTQGVKVFSLCLRLFHFKCFLSLSNHLQRNKEAVKYDFVSIRMCMGIEVKSSFLIRFSL